MRESYTKKKKILFLANHFITLFSFRKEIIQALLQQGHVLYLSLPEDKDNQYFVNLGCKIIPTIIDRRGINPINDLKLLASYAKIISEIDPDVIFSFTIKPNIYGTIVSNKLTRKDGTHYRHICNITGTGVTFLNDNLVSKLCKMLYRHSVKNCYKVFFQNSGDRDFFIKNKMVKENWDMIPGSGVNLENYKLKPLPCSKTINFIFIGRVMELKGIDEYLEASKIIKSEFSNTAFYIAGWNEEEKYKKIVTEYEKAGFVKYIGFQKDITEWIEKCHCTVLPSHGGEGVPNVLLESAAMGRICIGSRIAGTKDVIEDGKTGYLFDAGNTQSLVRAIKKVICLNETEMTFLGKAGRHKVESAFDRKFVLNKYLIEAAKA